MNKFHVLYLTGAPATGKTTLANNIKENIDAVEVFSYGEMLTKRINMKNDQDLVQNDLRSKSSAIITTQDVLSLDDELIEIVSEKRKNSHVVIDSHPVTKESYGYRITAFKLDVLRKINPSIIVTLFADPKVIVNRIRTASEGRPLVTEFEAHMHNNLQSSVAVNYSILLESKSYFLDSNQSQELLVNEIKRILG